MEEEYEALMKNKTWKLKEKPIDKKSISNKWVYTVKHDGRKKARLVARGFDQQYGEDFKETFSPVAQLKSVRFMLGIAVSMNLKIKQFDVRTAFLNGILSEEIYMDQPKGFDDGSNRYCKLNKSIYGLKQSAKCWNTRLVETLTKYGLLKSKFDNCVFYKEKPLLVLLIYVDDGLIFSNDEFEINKLMNYLQKHFDIKEEAFKMYLGMEVKSKADGIFINQENYVDKILNKFEMKNCKGVSTPMFDISSAEEGESVQVPYRQAIGSLLFLSLLTRPDITYATSFLSRYMDDPKQVHWQGIKRIFRYLQETKDFGIHYSKGKGGTIEMSCYTDADFAGDKTTRKSTSGYVLTLNGSLIDWSSRKQSIVTLSTVEAEYVAAAEGIKEAIPIYYFGKELGLVQDLISLKIDNQSSIRLIEDESCQKRTKHIDVKFHFIREQCNKFFEISYVKGENQLADIFTKALLRNRFENIRDKLNIRKEC